MRLSGGPAGEPLAAVGQVGPQVRPPYVEVQARAVGPGPQGAADRRQGTVERQALDAHVVVGSTRGWRVFGTSRRARPDERGVTMLRLDVRDDESIRSCVAEVVRRAGRVDVLVNNAEVMHSGFAEETTTAEATAVLDTNLLGAVRVTNAVLPGCAPAGTDA